MTKNTFKKKIIKKNCRLNLEYIHIFKAHLVLVAVKAYSGQNVKVM